MGQETKTKYYQAADLEYFNKHLKEETDYLIQKLQSGGISQDNIFGYEIEAWIIDEDYRPNGCSKEFLKKVNNKQITPEIAKYNFEINGSPFELNKDLTESIEKDMKNLFDVCEAQLSQLSSKYLIIGTHPDLRETDLCMKNVYPSNRYKKLNDEILKQREVDTHVHIRGVDIFDFHSQDIMIESQATSLQIHIQSNFDNFKDLYNASIIASPLMAAICANSPFVCGKSLWHESRIPIFEQAISLFNRVDGNFISRVGLGSDFIKSCPSELFLRNLQFSVLLPEHFESTAEDMNYLKFHNGTIWRWNRPVLSKGKDGNPNIRVEHRIPSTGPTQIDMVANMIYFYGVVHVIIDKIHKDTIDEFINIKRDLYLAAQNGINQEINWFRKKVKITELVNHLEEPICTKLKELGFTNRKTEYLVKDVIKHRVNKNRSGSMWQLEVFKQTKRLKLMLEQYYENQQSNIPVHNWKGW